MRYVLMTALLTFAYVGLVVLATQVLGFSAPPAVAGTTLAAALLFNLPRRRLQRTINRRFRHLA